jgi:saccharopine dehydrogenase-like NADP-dependent oxidoreductase
MNYSVLGAGMIGSAAAFDLTRPRGTTRVTLADINGAPAVSSVRAAKSALTHQVTLDVRLFDDTVRLIAGHDCSIDATC